MTTDEQRWMRYLLMNVRDELADLARRDPQIQCYVTDVEYCLKVLRRPGVRQGLTRAETTEDGPAPERSGACPS